MTSWRESSPTGSSHVMQTPPPSDSDPESINVDNRSKFDEIRNCHDKLSQVVAKMDSDDLCRASSNTSTPSRAQGHDGDRVLRQMNELGNEVKRQSEGQEDLKQGQLELKEQVTGLRETILSSKSMDDLYGDRGSLHQSVNSSTSAICKNCSRTNSCGSFPTVFTPTSDMSDMSSSNSFGMSGIEKQRDELEACLSREMIKNLENRLGRIELQDHQLSEKLLYLKERVQKLWHQSNRPANIRSSTSSLDTEPLPPHIKAFCMNIEDVIHLRVYDLARYLGLHEDFEVKGGYSYRRTFWIVIREWSKQCRNKGSILLLEHLLDACQKCCIPNPLEVEPMPPADRRVLEQNYSYLANHVMVPMVLTYLRDTGMLTIDLVRYVLEPEPRPERVTRLVDIITVFGKHALHLLKDSLRSSGQGHIADSLHCREEALDPAAPASALPSSAVRLLESLKCQLKEINTPTDQVRRQHEVCKLSTGKIWSGLFLNMNVSVKIPSHSVCSLRLLMEASQLRGLRHNHIIQLIGVSLLTDPPWIIMESVSGNLLIHVRNLQEDTVSFSTVLNMAKQVCSGMLHMECKGCIHGDLRAENVLLTENRTLKVANFHIRPPEDSVLSNCTRWSSPETIKHGVTSIKTDVWAFGILLWELVTLGLVPYPDMDMSEMTDKVQSGYIMSRPHTQLSLPDYIYDVMTTCWKFYASERPSFAHLYSLLSDSRTRNIRMRETPSGRSDVTQRTSWRSSSADSRRRSMRRHRSLPRDREKTEHLAAANVYVEDTAAQDDKKKKKKNLWQRLRPKNRQCVDMHEKVNFSVKLSYCFEDCFGLRSKINYYYSLD